MVFGGESWKRERERNEDEKYKYGEIESVVVFVLDFILCGNQEREREREREMESDDTNETTRHSSSGLVGVVSEGVSVIFSSFISFSTLFSRTFLS